MVAARRVGSGSLEMAACKMQFFFKNSFSSDTYMYNNDYSIIFKSMLQSHTQHVERNARHAFFLQKFFPFYLNS